MELQRKADRAPKSFNFIVKLAIPVFGLLLLVKYGIGSRTRSFIDPLFYALVINAVLVPLYFELNRLYAENAE